MTPASTRKYSTATALRVALDERARERRRRTGESIETARRRFAFEAFLRRIPKSEQPLVLKGGFLLHVRYPTGPRPTKDIDAAFNDPSLARLPSERAEARLREALQAVARVSEPDFFTFNVSEARQDLGADREFVGFRYSVTARLDSRVFETFQLDCTVGDALVLPLDKVAVGQSLAFIEGLIPVEVAGITPAQHLAEKLHAICRSRHDVSNRVKDLFDVVLLLQRGVTADDVIKVVKQVFAQAGEPSLERLAALVPDQWRVAFDEMAQRHNLGVVFDEATQLHRELCKQILGARPT
jgi:hypothetical protein